jgi:hypothetical protein
LDSAVSTASSFSGGSGYDMSDDAREAEAEKYKKRRKGLATKSMKKGSGPKK